MIADQRERALHQYYLWLRAASRLRVFNYWCIYRVI